MIVGLIPAHNESEKIADSVGSAISQVDRVIVISDNSSDDTVSRARDAGAFVVESVQNHLKKAGALNQAMTALLGLGPSHFPAWSQLADTDYLLVMDADSRVDDGFVDRALAEFTLEGVGAVGGIFLGERGGGLIGQLQRNEYVRYARDVARRGARARVLTGTATMMRVDVLRKVATARLEGELPGDYGVYDTIALTEDNELTLAIKTLGFATMSPRECIVHTEVMLTWRDLWHQRIRWQRGTLENLRQYGWTRVTAPYFLEQAVTFFGLLLMWGFVTLTIMSFVLGDAKFQPFWTSIGLIFVAERIVTVWKGGARSLMIAVPLVIEFVYGAFLQAVVMRSVSDIARGKKADWRHATDVRPLHKPVVLQSARASVATTTTTQSAAPDLAAATTNGWE